MGTSAATTLQETSQRFQVFHIFAQFFAFRCFEHFRNFFEPSVAHDETKRVEADLSFPDVLMSIYARAARGLGIVHVNGRESLESNHAIELTKCFLHACFAAD